MSAPENPPAFPVAEQRAFDGTGITEGHPGMTLRDWFAGQAMFEGINWVHRNETGGFAEAAAIAYEFADAMLAERSSK